MQFKNVFHPITKNILFGVCWTAGELPHRCPNSVAHLSPSVSLSTAEHETDEHCSVFFFFASFPANKDQHDAFCFAGASEQQQSTAASVWSQFDSDGSLTMRVWNSAAENLLEATFVEPTSHCPPRDSSSRLEQVCDLTLESLISADRWLLRGRQRVYLQRSALVWFVSARWHCPAKSAAPAIISSTGLPSYFITPHCV